MTEYKPDIVIYHANCDDGFGAAYVAWKKWGEEGIEYVPCNYGWDVPELDYKDKDVLIMDFSFSSEDCKKIVEQGGRIVMLDHHKTAKENLKDFDSLQECNVTNVDKLFEYYHDSENWKSSVICEFDMERSGARMAWDFIFQGEQCPQLILHIEDRDLWKFKYPDTKLVTMYLRTLDRKFNQWFAAEEGLEYNKIEFLNTARAVKRYNDKLVRNIADQAVTNGTFMGYKVAKVYCCPYDLVSEVCHELLQRHKDVDFAMAVIYTPRGTTYSMRSEDDRVDVSEFAKKRGGGGHRNAAGFSTDYY